MHLIAERGYDVHCLNLTQDGNWTSSYAKQIEVVQKYVAKLHGRPIIIGHSQGGTKVQNYLLAKAGDGRQEEERRAAGAVFLSSSVLDYSACAPPIIRHMMSVPRALACTAACFLGGAEAACFFGGGLLRHQLRTYMGMFNEETTATTILGGAAALVSLEQFGDALDGHEPGLTDFGSVEYGTTPSEVTCITDGGGGGGCQVLVLSGSRDRVVPAAMVVQNAEMWGTEPRWVEGQGHELGDAGWESAVMGPLCEFLDGIGANE